MCSLFFSMRRYWRYVQTRNLNLNTSNLETFTCAFQICLWKYSRSLFSTLLFFTLWTCSLRCHVLLKFKSQFFGKWMSWKSTAFSQKKTNLTNCVDILWLSLMRQIAVTSYWITMNHKPIESISQELFCKIGIKAYYVLCLRFDYGLLFDGWRLSKQQKLSYSV